MIPAFESRMGEMSRENDRLNGVIRTRIGEIENWKSKYTDIEKQISKYIDMEKEKKNL
jgi:hypothetical protein